MASLDFISPRVDIPSVWRKQIEIPVTNSETWLTLTVTKQPEMQADYNDLRFVINPTGTADEKVFLPYWIESSDGSSALVHVGFKNAPAVSSSFYMLYDNVDAESYSSGYATAAKSGWYFNDFSRGVTYDVVNVLSGYDKLLAGNPNGEETWPSNWQNPDNKLNCGVTYKRQDTNLHAGNPTTRVAMKVTTDGWQTWGDEIVIDDPDYEYNTTSTSSIAIPTTHPTQVTFTVADAGLPWKANDTGQVRADDNNYFDFTVASYTGTTLVVNSVAHVGSGTHTSWIISTRIGATNSAITAVKIPTGQIRLIMFTAHVDYTIGGGTIRVGSKYSDDFGLTWSTWTRQGPDQWINGSGLAMKMNNNYCIFGAHQNAGYEGMTEFTDWFFVTRDYGVTFSTHSVQLPGVYLDEIGFFQKKNPTTFDWIEDKVKVIMRVETSPFHYYTLDLTISETDITNTTPVENNFYLDEVSRASFVWCDDRVYGAFGDVREQMVYSDDSGDTWHPVPYTTAEGTPYDARRVYTVMYYLGNGKLVKIWTNNKLAGGADTYINYWDSYLMALRTVSTNTLTDENGGRNRPIDLGPGMRINGSLVPGYRGTSVSSIAVPTSHPTTVNFTTQTGLSWQAGDAGTITYSNNTAIRWTFTVDSYNSGNGAIQVSSVSNTGTGTQSVWDLDKTSNFQADQALVSNWNRNGLVNPFKVEIISKNPRGGFFGLKKDETRALATVTITDAGASGDVITIKWSTSSVYSGLFTGIGKVATYTVQSGDNIAAVVNGLVDSANSIGICPVSSSDGTTLTLFAPRGESTFINTRSFTISTTGTVAGSSGTFSGGAAMESVSALQNVIVIDKGNDVVRIEQANDNYSQALSNTDDVTQTYNITWDGSSVTATDGTTTRTKTASDGSGIPNWFGQLFMHVTTGVTTIFNYNETYRMRTFPVNTTVGTLSSPTAVIYTEKTIGNGIN